MNIILAFASSRGQKWSNFYLPTKLVQSPAAWASGAYKGEGRGLRWIFALTHASSPRSTVRRQAAQERRRQATTGPPHTCTRTPCTAPGPRVPGERARALDGHGANVQPQDPDLLALAARSLCVREPLYVCARQRGTASERQVERQRRPRTTVGAAGQGGLPASICLLGRENGQGGAWQRASHMPRPWPQ